MPAGWRHLNSRRPQGDRGLSGRGVGRVVLLTVQNLAVTYDGIRALHGIDFHIKAGEIVTIIGANGAGRIRARSSDGPPWRRATAIRFWISSRSCGLESPRASAPIP